MESEYSWSSRDSSISDSMTYWAADRDLLADSDSEYHYFKLRVHSHMSFWKESLRRAGILVTDELVVGSSL